MLEIRTETVVSRLEVETEAANSFKKPIIFYMAHRDDKSVFFITFVIIDFERKEKRYIMTYLPENIEKVENYYDKNLLKINFGRYNPHCSLQVKEKESFLTFIERTDYFYYVNYINNKAYVYTIHDLQDITGEFVTGIGCTLYKDECDENYFYSAITAKSKSTEEMELLFFRNRLDLSDQELVHRVTDFSSMGPHATRKFRNYLFNSEFHKTEIQFYDTVMTPNSFLTFVYTDLYHEFCLSKNKTFDEREPLEKNQFLVNRVILEPEFSTFCLTKGRNFLEICERDNRYPFSVKPGMISVLNLLTKDIDYYETTKSSPAHFEIDETSDTIYTSSHNFTFLDRHYYLGPAAIDKFVFVDGKLQKKGTFMCPDGYRFTTHKFFRHRGKPYICTFGQPNRLFFIDAETMSLSHCEDIGNDYLSSQRNIRDFLNENNIEHIVIMTIEVSEDGEYLFLLDHNYIYLYNISQKKITQKIEYRNDVVLENGLNLKDFYKRTTHSDYLQ